METILKFMENHPFWAVILFVFMILPIFGAIVHIIMKAMGQKGIDNTVTKVIDREPEPRKKENH